jgi:hypothetical protein
MTTVVISTARDGRLMTGMWRHFMDGGATTHIARFSIAS